MSTHANTRQSALDAELILGLTQAQLPQAPEPALARRVKARVLDRICASQHLTVQADAGGWRPFLPGIEFKHLHGDETSGVMSYYLKLAPGAVIPPHRHPHDEECIVLSGELIIGDLHVPAGGFHLARAGLDHAPISSVAGAMIFLRGAVPEASHLIG
jgi:anti-sigma factor ChrR (cupin superfamily)